ncbi:MAG: DUF4296 domain-containing protein [Cyclobacteriaceae bacterium]|nr:DUF4296 domain-containing protein [Cyclobacteriaceae bacterium]
MRSVKCYIALICAVATLTVACNRESRPPGVLSPAEFSKVLVEVYLAEARMSNSAFQRDSAIKLFVPFEEKLFRKFELPDSVVQKTYQYYLDNPEQLEKIYDSVIDTLSLREQKMRTKSSDKSPEKEKRTRKPDQ